MHIKSITLTPFETVNNMKRPYFAFQQQQQQQQQQPFPVLSVNSLPHVNYQRASQCLVGTTPLPMSEGIKEGGGGNEAQQRMQQQQFMPQHQHPQQNQQMQHGAVARQLWVQDSREGVGDIIPLLRGCYEGKTPIDALYRVAGKLGLKVELIEGDLASPSDPSSLAVPGQRHQGQMISILVYIDGRPCSYGTAATRGAAKHIASLEALRRLLVFLVHPMPFDDTLLVFPSQSGLNNPTFHLPALHSPVLQAISYRPMSPVPMLSANPSSPSPPRTPSTQYFPSFHLPHDRPSVSFSHGTRLQGLMIIGGEEEVKEDSEGAHGGGRHCQQQQHQRQHYQQQRPQQQLQQSTPLPSAHQDWGDGTLRGWGSTGGSTAFPPTPPPSPSIHRTPALPLIPTAVLVEDEREEGKPIQWPVGTKAPMLGESFVGGIAEATFLLNKLLQAFKSPSPKITHTEITAPAPSNSPYHHRCVGLRGFPSVLGYVCTVEVRLEGPALQVATLVRTKAQARSKKESLQLASRAVLAHLFPEATSLHQVEEALAQYQETKKEGRREMYLLNKKGKRLSRQQGNYGNRSMNVERQKATLGRVGKKGMEKKEISVEEGDEKKEERRITEKTLNSSPSLSPSIPTSSYTTPLSSPPLLLVPYLKPQPAASARPDTLSSRLIEGGKDKDTMEGGREK